MGGNGIGMRYMNISIKPRGKVLVDTNIFIYILDDADKQKQEAASQALSGLEANHTVIVSTQVLQEVYNVATRKVKVDPAHARTFVAKLRRFDIAVINVETIIEAMTTSELYRISFWDALLVAAAMQKKCTAIVTEDLSDGQNIHGIQIVNPFSR